MKRLKGLLKLSAIELLLAFAILIFSILFFALITDEVVIEQENKLDNRVFAFLNAYISPFTIHAATVVTQLGSGYFLIPAYLFILFYLFRIKKKREAIIVLILACVSILSGFLLKNIFQRSRPLSPLIDGVKGYSFPSGHSLGGFTFASILIYMVFKSRMPLINKKLLYFLCALMACLVGLSRMFLRVHFPSDVIGSFFITIIWLSLTFIVLQKLENQTTLIKETVGSD